MNHRSGLAFLHQAVLIFVLLAGCLSRNASAAPLTSQFFSADANALQVMAGTDYAMNDPAWFVNISYQNRNTFAYKVFAGLFMLGYQTEIDLNRGLGDQHLRALRAFQTRNGLPVTNTLTSACLSLMDQQLVVREQELNARAGDFLLRPHMQPLHANDISPNTLAVIYSLPMTVLPANLRMDLYEEVQCIGGQCNGFIQDAAGANIVSWPTPIDLNSDYRFVGAYFDPLKTNTRLPSAAVHVNTVLHEYAHYLDGIFAWSKDGLQPHIGIIDTRGFHDISYDLSSGTYCYTKRSSDPKDWITKYGYNPGYGNCAAGAGVVFEEWAESFSMYVAAGRHFRAATQQSTLIAQKYAWLKTHVFGGQEFDTDLPRGIESGCNDIYGTSAAQPGYAKCDDSYVWDFRLPLLAVTANATGNGVGSVTSSAGGISFAYPAENTGSAPLDYAAAVTLTATAAAGSSVTWSGNCSTTGGSATEATCMIASLDGAKNVTATFTRDQFTITTHATGNGSGTITSGNGILDVSYQAENTGSLLAEYGSMVVLTATANPGSAVSWSGECTETGGSATTATCSIDSITSARTVTASFTLNQHLLTVDASGGGSGSISTPSGVIACSYPETSTASALFSHASSITASATASAGSTVTWTGCDATGGDAAVATCTINALSAARTVSALFTPVAVTPPAASPAEPSAYAEVACPASATAGNALSVTVTVRNQTCNVPLTFTKINTTVIGNAGGTLFGLGVYGPFRTTIAPLVAPAAACEATGSEGASAQITVSVVTAVNAALAGTTSQVLVEALTPDGQVVAGGECMVPVQ